MELLLIGAGYLARKIITQSPNSNIIAFRRQKNSQDLDDRASYQYSDILDNYVVTQLNLLNGKLIPKDKNHYFSNIFQLSNFIFVEKNFFFKNKHHLVN